MYSLKYSFSLYSQSTNLFGKSSLFVAEAGLLDLTKDERVVHGHVDHQLVHRVKL